MVTKSPSATRPTSLLEGLLERLPGAAVATIGADGRFVPIPSTLDFGGRHVVEAAWALDLVPSGDKAIVIEAWAQACRDGFSEANVRSAGDQSPLAIYLVDVRETHPRRPRWPVRRAQRG